MRKNIVLGLHVAAPDNATEPNPQPEPLAIRAEAIRSSLWSLSEGDGMPWPMFESDRKPVHILRLLHAAGRLVAPLATGEDVEEGRTWEQLRSTLLELDLLGDLAELPNGYWLPAPLRAVPLDGGSRWLLIGGQPSRTLPTLKAELRTSGATRLLRRNPQTLGLGLPIQSLRDWKGEPEEQLEPWTSGVMKRCHLLPYDGSDQFEAYVPTTGSRWVERFDGLENGRFLLRLNGKRGFREYSIGEINRGRLIATGSLDTGLGDVQRLTLGLDSSAGKPRRVTIDEAAGLLRLRMPLSLPQAEYRLIRALGRDEAVSKDRHYPRYWKIPKEHSETVISALRGLGLAIERSNLSAISK